MQLNQTQMTAVMVDTLHVYLLLACTNGKAKREEIYPAVDQFRNVLMMSGPIAFQRYVDEFMNGNRDVFNSAVRTLHDG